MGYLLAISFLLHLITLFIIVVLVQKVNTMKPSSDTAENEKMKREIEDLLMAYTAEMKEENEKLVNKIIQKRKTQENLQFNTVKTYEQTRTKNTVQEKPVKQPIYSEQDHLDNDDLEGDYLPPQITETEDTVEQSTTSQILSLAKQGYSTKEIAKTLNIGDGEVQLLLKFHK